MLVASAVGITVSALTAGAGTGFGIAIIAGAAGGAASSMTGALLNGANFGQIMKAGAIGGFWGAVGAGVSFGVGQLKFDNIVGKMLAHGTTQGALTAAQGGKFQHGFFAAAFSAGTERYTGKINSNAGKVAASSIVGGTASVLGGGKFANGAITGAYVMLFNFMQHPDKEKAPWDKNGDGKLSKIEADIHWELGNGEPITIDGNLIDLTGLKIEKASYDSETGIYSYGTVRAFKDLPWETASTYGGFNFKMVNGKPQMQSELYHYNYRPVNSFGDLVRNIMNFAGKPMGIMCFPKDYMMNIIY